MSQTPVQPDFRKMAEGVIGHARYLQLHGAIEVMAEALRNAYLAGFEAGRAAPPAPEGESGRPHCPVMNAPCSDRDPAGCRERGCYKQAWPKVEGRDDA